MNTQKYKDAKTYDSIFCDLHESLDLKKAQVEASRCYYCYDAPCIKACPTQIDIPSFIRKISNQNTKGAALDILSANIMGGTCARACPVEVLCQQSCVRNVAEDKPVEIGHLQRYATDEYFKRGEKPFKHGQKQIQSSPKTIAIVGAGPAGLSCAHELSLLGYKVEVFEAKEKSGGLNEYGLAPYKMTNDFAQKEIDFILGVGGIKIEYGKKLGQNLKLSDLKSKYAAVFLGIGLGSNRKLQIPGEEFENVIDATKMIEKIRQTKDVSQIEVPTDVVVIGAGNTAIDIAVQMKRLGSENVTLVYRRGEKEMTATQYEREVAQKHGVLIKTWSIPVSISKGQAQLKIEFERSEIKDGKLVGTGSKYSIKASQIFKAIGQTLSQDSLSGLKLEKSGKLEVDQDFKTSISGIFAGGDAVSAGEDLTVTAVAHGKKAAHSINKFLSH